MAPDNLDIKFCNVVIPDIDVFNSYLKDSVDFGQMSNFGPCYRKLETALSKNLELNSNKGVVVVSSGHTALMAACSVLGLKSVVIPCYTFESTRVAATLQGVGTVVLDVDKETGALDFEALVKVPLESYDGVILVCPLSSIPDIPKFQNFCGQNNKKLIIDGAATFGSKGIFNYGDAFCLSFHSTKSFPVGEAGAIVINSELVSDVERYITFGLDLNKVASGVGINAKISELTAAYALSLLETIDEHLERRLENSAVLHNLFGHTLVSICGDKTVYQSFPIFIPRADEARSQLVSQGVSCIKYYKPLIYDESRFPNTVDLYNSNVCLPVHSGVSVKQVVGMVRVLERLG